MKGKSKCYASHGMLALTGFCTSLHLLCTAKKRHFDENTAPAPTSLQNQNALGVRQEIILPPTGEPLTVGGQEPVQGWLQTQRVSPWYS